MALGATDPAGLPCHDGPVSVEFDPVRLGSRATAARPGRGRRGARRGRAGGRRPQALGIDRPGGGIRRGRRSPRWRVARVVGGLGPTDTTDPFAPARRRAPRSTTEVARPTWTEIAPVVGGHDEWGTLALVGRASRFTASGAAPIDYASRWDAGPPGAGRGSVALLEPDDLTVVALGLTFPFGQAPDDVRIWQRRAHDQLDWVDATASAARRWAVRSCTSGPVLPIASVEPWQAGRYRLDVLRRGQDRPAGSRHHRRRSGTSPSQSIAR